MNLCEPSGNRGQEGAVALNPPGDVPSGTESATVELKEEEEEDDEKDTRLPSDTYDSLICAQCVRSNKLLTSLAGTKGFMMLLPPRSDDVGDDNSKVLEDGWRILGFDGDGDQDKDEEPNPKRIKLDSGLSQTCTRPTPNTQAQAILSDTAVEAKGDVFLSFGARQSLCLCKAVGSHQCTGRQLINNKCKNQVESLPFPLEDEELYEPPRDTSPGQLTLRSHKSQLTIRRGS